MNCKNCGMPLVGSVCEYCGTRYDVLNAHVEPLIIYKHEPMSSEEINEALRQINESGLLLVHNLDDVEVRYINGLQWM